MYTQKFFYLVCMTMTITITIRVISGGLQELQECIVNHDALRTQLARLMMAR